MSVLLLATSLFLFQTSNEALTKMFLDGSEKESGETRKRLLDRGLSCMNDLLKARKNGGDQKKQDRLSRLIFFMKRMAQGSEDHESMAALDLLVTSKITIKFSKSTIEAALLSLNKKAKINIAADPRVEENLEREIDLDFNASSIRHILDRICTLGGLDYDRRFGVILVSSGTLLWGSSPPLNEEQLGKIPRWLHWIGSVDGLELSRRFAANPGQSSLDDWFLLHIALMTGKRTYKARYGLIKATYEHPQATIPLLEEEVANPNKKIADFCRSLLKEASGKELYLGISSRLLRKRQKQTGYEQDVVGVINETSFPLLSFYYASVWDISRYLSDYTGVPIVSYLGDRNDLFEEQYTFELRDVKFSDMLSFLTIPVGLNFKIDGRAVILFDATNQTRIPRVNRWENQDLGPTDAPISYVLESMILIVKHDEPMPLGNLLDWLSGYSEIPFRLKKGTAEPKIRIVFEGPFKEVLRHITIPYGLDAKIEDGGVFIFPRKK